MSRKLATTIKDSAIPGKYKRVLEAYAAFANNDGTNIRPSQRQLGGKASTSRYTIFRNTPDLIASGILRHATSHTCKVKECNKGATHFTGTWGRWTLVYEIHISQLQNAVNYLVKKCDKVNVAKRRKVVVAKCDTTQALPLTPAPAAPTLGTIPDSSALRAEIESEQVSPSLATLAAAPSARPASPEKKKATPQGLEFASEEKGNPKIKTEIEENFWTEQIFEERGELLFNITPRPSAAAIEKGLPICDRILEHFDDVDEDYRALAATMVLKYNRAHRDHKFATKDDRKLCIRTPEQFLKALESDNATLMNDYLNHEHELCELCVGAGAMRYRTLIQDIIKDNRQKEEQQRKEKIRLAEEARLAKLCARCQKVPFGSMRMEGFNELFTNGIREVAKRVCDQCYDDAFESQQRSGMHVRHVLTARPGYLEAKRAAAEAAKLEEQRRKTNEIADSLAAKKAVPKLERCGNPDCLEILVPGEEHECREAMCAGEEA